MKNRGRGGHSGSHHSKTSPAAKSAPAIATLPRRYMLGVRTDPTNGGSEVRFAPHRTPAAAPD